MTKRKNVKGYLAIEENGVEVWPKALVEAVYLACSEEMQRLKNVGTENVVKMFPVRHRSRYTVAVLLMSRCQKCEYCRIRELSCKLKPGARTDGMSCSNCSGKNHCSRPADYMWRVLRATWAKEYSVTQNEFRHWYPKVMSPQSIYVIKDGPKSEVRTREGGKVAKKKSKDQGESPDSAEDKEEQKEEEKEEDGDKDKEEEEDEQGDNQDPSPSTSGKCSQGSSYAASTPNRRPQSQKPAESPVLDLHLKVENTRLRKELESVKEQLWDSLVDGDAYRTKYNSALSVQTEVESENERLRARLLEFEKFVGEFTEDTTEKQTGGPDIARFRQGSAGERLSGHLRLLFILWIELYSVLDTVQGQNEEFRQHLNSLMNDSLLLRLRLDIHGHPESQLHKDMEDKLREMAVGVLNLPGPVWTTVEKERIERIFNPAEGSSGNKRPGGDLEEEAGSRRKRGRMLLKGKSVGQLGSESN